MADNFNTLDTPIFTVGPSGGSASASLLKPAAALAENFNRNVATSDQTAAIASGTLKLAAIPLPSGLLVSSVTFVAGNTAGASLTHQWFAMFDSSRVMLGVTGDDTSTGWSANAAKTLTLGAAFRTTYSGLHYVGIMVSHTGTIPSLLCQAAAQNGIVSLVPIIAGTSNTSQSTPQALPFTATALTSSNLNPYCYVS